MAGVVKTKKRADHNFQRKGGTNEDIVRETDRPVEKLTRRFEKKSHFNGVRQQESYRRKCRAPEKT